VGLPVQGLTETYQDVMWTHYKSWSGDFFSPTYNEPECWANPETFIDTHWATAVCAQVQDYDPSSYVIGVAQGVYMNVDFPMQVCYTLGICIFGYGITPILTTVHGIAGIEYGSGGDAYGILNMDVECDDPLLYAFETSGLLSAEPQFDADEYACTYFCDPGPDVIEECDERGSETYWDYNICDCTSAASPIVIDLEPERLRFTDISDGVTFDIKADGRPVRTAWTAPGSREGFLVLDRNHNGTIDSGAELFGNFTAQPPARRGEANGFLALAVFDDAANGGNGDGQISEDDAIFNDLRIWIDANHDGISQAGELKTLRELGVVSISLRYTVSKKVDEFGNILRFRGHVVMDDDLESDRPARRAAVDVLFRIAQ
jgi:hypothetical protein